MCWLFQMMDNNKKHDKAHIGLGGTDTLTPTNQKMGVVSINSDCSCKR